MTLLLRNQNFVSPSAQGLLILHLVNGPGFLEIDGRVTDDAYSAALLEFANVCLKALLLRVCATGPVDRCCQGNSVERELGLLDCGNAETSYHSDY